MSPERVLLGEERGRSFPVKGQEVRLPFFQPSLPFSFPIFAGQGQRSYVLSNGVYCCSVLLNGLLLFRPVKWSTDVLSYGLLLFCLNKWANALLSCHMVYCCSVLTNGLMLLSYGLLLFFLNKWANALLSCHMVYCYSVLTNGLMLFCPVIWSTAVLS